MAVIPYDVSINIVLTSLAQGDLNFPCPAGQRFRAKRWIWAATGIFNLIDLRVQTTQRFTNANSTFPILSTFLRTAGSANFNLDQFDSDLVVDPNNTLSLTVIDTSGAGNTIRVVLRGTLDTQATS